MSEAHLKNLAKLIRYYILNCTTKASSGHPTSSLSATDLMTVLMFGGFFKYDAKDPKNPNNDRLIFSKGHAAPLFYSLWTAAGEINEEELMTLRTFNSRLEGHPTMSFPFTEAATGSLGQGLSVGAGMALNAKNLDKLPYKTYVLLGDSEMAEGSVWEAMAFSAFYKLNNLVAIVDVNRLGQRGETMYGHNLKSYAARASAFGWETIVVDGHNIRQITAAFTKANKSKDKPVMILAKTLKGKGVSAMENINGWHGKTLPEDVLPKALKELGKIDTTLRGNISKPAVKEVAKYKVGKAKSAVYKEKSIVSTRQAYGNSLVKLHKKYPNIVALDAEVSNSTYADLFKNAYPDRFFEMYIAEQNMVGVALGLSQRNKIPFVSTFAAFFSRAFDQIRMSQYSDANIKFVGSHAGVSIGEDGPSQMGLEDISMFRSILNSVVLYPADGIATEKLIDKAAQHHGIVYIRTTREKTPILYNHDTDFHIGGCNILKADRNDIVTIISAGITLYEVLEAYKALKAENISARIIDLYSIKPIDITSLERAARDTRVILTVEDHYLEGGLGEAVGSALSNQIIPIHSLAVRKTPKSGTPQELLNYEDISKSAIIAKVKEIIK